MATVQISNDIALLGHLIRRAGFGASASRLESLQTMSYEQVVDELINENIEMFKKDFPKFTYNVVSWKRKFCFQDNLKTNSFWFNR